MNKLMNGFHRVFTIFLAGTLFFIASIFTNGLVDQAFAKPLTPEAASYEIDHASSAEAAGQTLKNQARAYKSELAEDSNYTKQAAKRAAQEVPEKTGNVIDTVREKLNLNEPVHSSTKELLSNPKQALDDGANSEQQVKESIEDAFQGQD